MDVTKLKEYIYSNNLLDFILEKIGCHSISHFPLDIVNASLMTDKYVRCANYDGDNPTAISISLNKHLNVSNYTREKEFKKLSNSNEGLTDIVTLVRYNLNLSFKDAIKYLHDILELPYNGKLTKEVNSKNNFNPLQIFEDADSTPIIPEFDYLDEKVLDRYEKTYPIEWLKIGIVSPTAIKFDIRYDRQGDNVVIPLRSWYDGRLLGYKMRTMVKDADLLGISKYQNSKNYPKNQNIYGLWEHRDDILKAGYVVIYEAEKSVLIRDSFMDCTGVAIGGHSLSDTQVDILLSLGGIEVVIAFDKDVSIQEIRYTCQKFYGLCPVSYIYDYDDVLDEKDSPVDKGNKVFNKLFENRVVFDASEFELYLNCFSKNVS